MDRSHKFCLSAATIVATGLFVCAWAAPQNKMTVKPSDVNNPAFHKALLDAAANYRFQYEELDALPRIANALCGSLIPAKQPVLKTSSSDNSETHGKKLYFLYLKDKDSYVALRSDTGNNSKANKVSKPGQTLVKESWIPRFVPGDAPFGLGVLLAKLVPDTKGQLFIMLKTAPQTPETDDGWVYGTLTADGKTVTSSGRVQSCMSCHQAAPYDRLYAVKETPNVATVRY